MNTFFLTCLAVGGVVLVAQFVLALVGVAEGADASHHGHHVEEGLQLFSVRSIAAALTFFGVGGLAARALGAPTAAAAVAALTAGLAASVATAAAMRAMLRMEHDATVRLDRAVGAAGTVYVPVPAGGGGAGKVLLTLQGRTVECQAVTPDPRSLPTGTQVTVVDVRGADLVEVVPITPLPPSTE